MKHSKSKGKFGYSKRSKKPSDMVARAVTGAGTGVTIKHVLSHRNEHDAHAKTFCNVMNYSKC